MQSKVFLDVVFAASGESFEIESEDGVHHFPIQERTGYGNP